MLAQLDQSFAEACDYVDRVVETAERKFRVVYMDSLVDSARLHEEVMRPLMSLGKNSTPLVPGVQGGIITSIEEAMQRLLNGCALVSSDNSTALAYGEVPNSTSRAVETASAETTISGPQDGFVERLAVNLTLVRQRLRTPNLKCLRYVLGEKTGTTMYLLYLDGVAPNDMVEQMKQRLSHLHLGEVLDTSYLETLIGVSPLSPFPQTYYTQRPDKVAGNLLEGRLALMLDGSPSALVTPSAFSDLFQSPVDYYSRPTYTLFIRMIRVIGFFLATTLPALYISITSFDLEILPVQLAIPIATFRAGLPFSPAVEAFLAVAIMDILQEGATRLPAKIGQTVGVVGGLVLGQAVIQAKLFSPLLIIVVSTSAIGSFTLPNYEVVGLTRIIRYVLLLSAGALSGIGIALAWSALFIHMCSIETLGVPYLRPVAPLRLNDHSDFLLHLPYRTREPGIDRRVKDGSHG